MPLKQKAKTIFTQIKIWDHGLPRHYYWLVCILSLFRNMHMWFMLEKIVWCNTSKIVIVLKHFKSFIGIPFTPLGGLLGGIFGRRKIILLCQPFGIISWIMMANAQNIPTLFFSRFLSSVAITCHIASPGQYYTYFYNERYNNKEFPYILLWFYILGVYTAETVHPKIRNNLTILPSIFTCIGMLSVWIIGFFAHWRTTAYIFMIPHIVIFLCMLPLPESPYWLIEANKIDLAEYDQFYRVINQDWLYSKHLTDCEKYMAPNRKVFLKQGQSILISLY